MNVVEVLQNEDFLDIRLTCGRHRWLVFSGKVWVVYERLPYARHTTVLIETEWEEHAVAVLIAKEDE